MALTISIKDDLSFSSTGYDGYRVHASIAFDASYPTGGEAASAGNFGLQQLLGATITPAGGYNFEWDQENEKILVYYGGGDASAVVASEVNDTGDLSALTGVQMFVVGR